MDLYRFIVLSKKVIQHSYTISEKRFSVKSGEKQTWQKGMIALSCNGKLHEESQMYTTVGGAT